VTADRADAPAADVPGPRVPGAAVPEPVPALDLDAAARPASGPRSGPRGRVPVSRWWFLGAGLVAGVLVGHAWQGPAAAPEVPAPAPAVAAGPELRMSMSAFGSGVEPALKDGKAVIRLLTVVTNDGTEPLTLLGVRVEGPGAALGPSPEAHARLTLPLILPVAETTEVPLTLTSDCAVPVRPLPAITLIVRGASGAPRVVGVRIPDLDRLWGFTLNDSVCPPAPPAPAISYAP
jgi:hypothetical protein